MRIALLCKTNSGGGVEAVLGKLHFEFLKLGHESRLLTMSEPQGGGRIAASQKDGTVVLGRSFGSAAVGFSRFLREARPDVVLSGQEQANLLNVAARCVGHRHRAIVSRHIAFDTGESQEGGALRTMAAAAVYKSADHVAVVSDGIRRELIAAGVNPNKVSRIYNPVVDENFHALTARSPEKPVPSAEGALITACGRLVPQKGFDVLLRSFARVRKIRRVRLMILGEGPDENALKALAVELGIRDDVFFLGYVRNPNPYYRMSDCFVLSSRWEGFGLALAEALACGTKVVATDCKHGPREILRDGKLGPLAQVDNVEHLALSIVAGLDWEGPVAAEDLARFNVSSAADAYLQLFTAALKSREYGRFSRAGRHYPRR